MRRSREMMRRLLLQPLERRCMMDASGFDEAMEAAQNTEFEATSMMYESTVADSSEMLEKSADESGLADEGVDTPRVMYFSMAGDSSLDGLDDGTFDISEVERTLEEDDSIQTFGATSSTTDEMMQTTSFEETSVEYWLDIDQNGLVSAVDAWMIINSINSADGLASSEFDVDGDSVVSPLDVLIVINELNSAQAGANGFAAPAISSSRFAARINPEWTTNSGDLTASSSLPIEDDSSFDESKDDSALWADSVLADFGDASDDASFVGRLMPIASYKIASSLDDASKEDAGSDVSSDSEIAETENDGTEVDAPHLFA